MELLKERVYVLNVLIFMVVLSLGYILYLSITVGILVNELQTKEVQPVNNTYITVINYTTPKTEVKGISTNVPNTKPVIKKESKATPKKVETKPKPVVEEKPKVVVKKEAPKTTTDGDTYLLAQIINAEAKGEPYNGKVAVGNVVMNRVKHPDFPKTIEGVIFQKGQFSPVTSGSIYNKPSEEALKAAKEVLNGKQIVGEQALYFYNPATSTSDWIFSRKTIMDIGNHRFAH